MKLPPVDATVEQIFDRAIADRKPYVVGQAKRIKLSIRYAKKLHVVRGEVIDIAGHTAGEVYDAWRLSFPGANIQATTSDLHDPLPFAADSFDGAIAGEIFEHIGDRDFRSSISNFRGVISLLAETLRVLKPGGRCLLTTPNAASYKNIALAMCGAHPFMYVAHYREYTKIEIQRMLRFVGAKVVVFETNDVFRQSDEFVQDIRKFVERYRLPTDDRGNDFFLVFEKPDGWQMPVIPRNTSQIVYPHNRRSYTRPWSFVDDRRYEGEV